MYQGYLIVTKLLSMTTMDNIITTMLNFALGELQVLEWIWGWLEYWWVNAVSQSLFRW